MQKTTNLKVLQEDIQFRNSSKFIKYGKYSTTSNGTCQSNILIYGLECRWYNIKYVGQMKIRTVVRFHGHFFDIKSKAQTKAARYFATCNETTETRMIIHILEYIRTLKDAPTANSFRGRRELVWIHRPNTIITTGLHILDWGRKFRRS